MKKILTLLILLSSAFCFSQTAASTFPETTVSLSLSPISLPGNKSTLAGAETDVLINPSNTFALGPTSILGSSMVFTGGRVNVVIKPISTYIQNHSPNLNGYQFQFGVTSSVGVVKPVGSVGNVHWGERAGVFVNYAINGNWGTAVDVQWGNFTGVQSNTWTLAFGPNFHF